MKAFLLLLGVFIAGAVARGQIYSSSCTPSDSMEIIYHKDACKLAIQRLFETGSHFADSIVIPENTIDSIEKALYAVHNIQNAGVGDTLRKIFGTTIFYPGSDSSHIVSVGTGNTYNLKSIYLTVPHSITWSAQWISGNYDSTLNDSVNYLINYYHLAVERNGFQPYQDSSIYTVRSPVAINTVALSKQFQNLTGTGPAYTYPEPMIGDGNRIRAEFEQGRILLSYRYGCGDCPLGCNLGRSWKFVVNTETNCSIEYVSVENWGAPVIWITAPCLDYHTTTTLCHGDSTMFFFNGGGSIQWQVSTDGITYNNISDNSNYTGTNTGALTLKNIPSSWYGNTYTCLSNGESSKLFYKIKFANNWTGNSDTAWENAANWSCGSLPDSYTDITISTGTVFLNSDVIVRSLTVAAGATLTVAPGRQLTVLH